MYIAIEGIDTAGKSTQIQALKEIYPNAIFTKEPGGTKIGKRLREIVLFKEIQNPITEMFIFLADRAEHIQKIIKPNLDKFIISDRSVISGIAYANIAQKIALDELIKLNSFACNNIFPQRVIILKLSEQELIKRLLAKKHDQIEERGIKYLLEIQDGLINVAKQLHIKLLVINAALHVNTITKQILNFTGEKSR